MSDEPMYVYSMIYVCTLEQKGNKGVEQRVQCILFHQFMFVIMLYGASDPLLHTLSEYWHEITRAKNMN